MAKTKYFISFLAYLLLLSLGMYGLHLLETKYFVIQFSGYQHHFMLQLLAAEQRADIIDRLFTVSCEGKRAITMYIGSSAVLIHVLVLLLHSYHRLLVHTTVLWLRYLYWLTNTILVVCYCVIYYYLFQWVMDMEWNADFAYYYWATRLFAISVVLLLILPWLAKLIPTKNYEGES